MTPTGWSTWNPERPAELSDPASGFRVIPVLYADRAGSFTALPPGPKLRLGPRAIDGGEVAFETTHQDTRLAWRYDLLGPDGIGVEWRTLANGEWGLRFWVTLCVSGPEGARFAYEAETGRLRGFDAEGAPCLEIRAAKDPLLVTFHEGLEALAQEFETQGYFYLVSRGTEGRFAALRFNLEEAPDLRLVISTGAAAQPDLPGEAEAIPAPAAMGPAQESLQAIHDIMAWNHVFDAVNGRPYTALTRNWNARKFGGFGVWLNDVLYNALLWSLFDAETARRNIEAVFAWQTEEGNFPCLVTGNDAWVDRSQPPIAAYVVWSLFQREGGRDLLEWAYPRLLRNHDWWWRRRRLADTGLVAYGTSPGVGTGLYKGTKLAAKNESSMDNSPLHDPAPFDAGSGLLLSADVGLNSLLALDGEVLALMARTLGRAEEAGRLEAQVAAHRQCIGDWLWDERRGVFANRLLSGDFVEALAPTSFFPLAAGAATPEQADSLVARYLLAPEKFGGPLGLPSVARDQPASRDNVYWRGRIWGPLNFWTYLGLRRSSREAEAAGLAEMSGRLFDAGWRERLCGENYNAETGAITDQADTDAFYSWGALLPALRLSEVLDLSPWQELSLAPGLAAGELGPLLTPWGRVTLAGEEGNWRVQRDGQTLIAGSVVGRLSRVTFTDQGFQAELPAAAEREWLRFARRTIAAARLDGTALTASGDRLNLPPRQKGARLEVAFD